MAKRPRNMQIEAFEKRLDQSDELTKELLQAIHGDPALGIEGLVPRITQFSSRITNLSDRLEGAVTEISHLKDWKRMIQENKGVIQFKLSRLIQRILAIVGAIGVLVAAGLGVTQIIDWLYKQGILTQSERIGQILNAFSPF